MKVLLAIDDSPYSQEATRTLLAHCRTQDAEVRVLSVVEPIGIYISADAIPHYVPQIEEIEMDLKKQAAELVKKVAKDLREAGFKASDFVDFGDAKTVIIDNATKWGADLIVVGSHGLKGLNRFLLGSVSEAVARHAPCSVEIVRVHPVSNAGKQKK